MSIERTEKKNTARVMIAAAGSGSGKTLITCALLEVMRRRGMDMRAYKCGPDYIDPMFHRRVLGIESSNLDSFFSDRDEILDILGSHPDAHTVIEGVMGIYDGMDVSDTKGSCYEIAEITDTPVILVVDASGTGRTVISQIKGILADDRYGLIRGIILNRISGGFYEKLLPCLKKELKDEGYDRVEVLGGIPQTDGVGIESRHLGLKLPDEIEDIRGKIERFADAVERNCDTDGIIRLMESAPGYTCTEREKTGSAKELNSNGPVIAVARDEAFCFYYEENIEALKRAGARIEYFSPIHDEKLPEGCRGILLGGGYPELYAEELSSNASMINAIREAVGSGMPSLAECGGFMYLHRTIKDKDNREYGLTGVIDGECTYTGHLVRFGYMQLKGTDDRDIKAFGRSITGIKGHEFHYYDSTDNGTDAIAIKPGTGKTWECMIAGDNRLWGFPHLYYPSCEGLAEGFVKAASEFDRS